jgi:hypothetical protein
VVDLGRVIEPEAEFCDGTVWFVGVLFLPLDVNISFISQPKPFQCTIEPRSSRSVVLISAEG